MMLGVSASALIVGLWEVADQERARLLGAAPADGGPEPPRPSRRSIGMFRAVSRQSTAQTITGLPKNLCPHTLQPPSAAQKVVPKSARIL